MCGFLGVSNKSFYHRKEDLINTSFKWIKHRGPDESKTLLLEKFFIGFHRLSIVGVENNKASQPIKLRNNSNYFMFNGEIFNYKKVAKERLDTSKIHSSYLTSDTLVLSMLLEKYGLECLNWLDGMFSIAIINDESGELTLIRDRYGIKPLYYFIDQEKIIFCSHIKPIIDISGYKKQNKNAIYTYLKEGLYDHSQETFFKNVKSVPPGHSIKINVNNMKIDNYRWYKIEDNIQNFNRKNNKTSLEEIDHLITEVISDYIPEEVDFALNVSGGVDSTLLISRIKKNSDRNFILLNQDYEDPYSEKKWMEKYSKILNVSPFYFSITPKEIMDDLKESFLFQAQPFGGITIPGYTPLYKKANQENCKVILDGTGLDEAFLGYSRYRNDFEYHDKNNLGDSGPKDPRGLRDNAISDSLRNSSHLLNSYIDDYLDGIKCPSPRMKSILDICSNKIPRTLRFNDHISSRFSTELRTPFLSHRILHLGFKIPHEKLISQKGTKLPIRDLLSKDGMGEIAYAPKRYIQTPQTEWFKKEIKFLVGEYIFSESFFERGWIKQEVIKNEYEKFLNKNTYNSFFLWQWFSLEYWARMNFD